MSVVNVTWIMQSIKIWRACFFFAWTQMWLNLNVILFFTSNKHFIITSTTFFAMYFSSNLLFFYLFILFFFCSSILLHRRGFEEKKPHSCFVRTLIVLNIFFIIAIALSIAVIYRFAALIQESKWMRLFFFFTNLMISIKIHSVDDKYKQFARFCKYFVQPNVVR